MTRKELLMAAYDVLVNVYKLENPLAMDDSRLADLILEFTKKGKMTRLLSKNTREVVEALVDGGSSQEAKIEQPKAKKAAAKKAKAEPVKEEQPKVEEQPEQEYPSDLTSREAMNIAAQEMNRVMGLQPPIDITLDGKLFKNAFMRSFEWISPADKFSDYTLSVFNALGLVSDALVKPEPKTKKAAAKKATKLEPVKEEQPAKTQPKPEPKKTQPKAKVEEQPEPKPKAKKEAPKKREANGVTAFIRAYIDEKFTAGDKLVDRKQLMAALENTFLDRDPRGMATTMRIAVPSKLTKIGYVFRTIERGVFQIIRIPE